MSDSQSSIGFPPRDVITLLRLDGLAIFAASLAGYQVLGGNWWVFALLILAPDLSMFGALAGSRIGARIYNLAHILVVPITLGGLAWLAGATWFLPYSLIWIAHIGMDRAAGYGLKYPGLDHSTHLGLIGKARKSALADTR